MQKSYTCREGSKTNMDKENIWFVRILRLQVSVLLKWLQCYLCNTHFLNKQ